MGLAFYKRPAKKKREKIQEKETPVLYQVLTQISAVSLSKLPLFFENFREDDLSRI